MNNIYKNFNKIILNGKEININDISKKEQKRIIDWNTTSFSIIKELKKIYKLMKNRAYIKAVVATNRHPEYAFSTDYIITRNGDVFSDSYSNNHDKVITIDSVLKEILTDPNTSFVFNINVLNLDKIKDYNLGSNFLRVLTGGYGWGDVHEDETPYEEIRYLIRNL